MSDRHRKDERPAPSGAVAHLVRLPERTPDAARRKSGRAVSLRPVRLTESEAEVIVIGLSNAVRDDPRLSELARSALAKLAAASGASTRARLAKAWANTAQPQPVEWDELLGIVEDAIQDERELRIRYEDRTGEDTIRTIRPLAFAESRKGESVAAWCNLRGDFRHFRLDRIAGIVALDSFFKGEGERLRQRYMIAGD
jgi:predicted DNA-binding transcriptional regulator YafY